MRRHALLTCATAADDRLKILMRADALATIQEAAKLRLRVEANRQPISPLESDMEPAARPESH